MALLNAPEYDARKEKLKVAIIAGSGSTLVLLILLTLAGYVMGHGWLFTNLPAEHTVDTFFTALEAKDYDKAYALYTNDDDFAQHAAQRGDEAEVGGGRAGMGRGQHGQALPQRRHAALQKQERGRRLRSVR